MHVDRIDYEFAVRTILLVTFDQSLTMAIQ
jgi:hypothetical protein